MAYAAQPVLVTAMKANYMAAETAGAAAKFKPTDVKWDQTKQKMVLLDPTFSRDPDAIKNI